MKTTKQTIILCVAILLTAVACTKNEDNLIPKKRFTPIVYNDLIRDTPYESLDTPYSRTTILYPNDNNFKVDTPYVSKTIGK